MSASRKDLPYRVYCRSTHPFFELIAAFNIQPAAESYARECAAMNGGLQYDYQVRRGSKVLLNFPSVED